MTNDKLQYWINYLDNCGFIRTESFCNEDREILITTMMKKNSFEILFQNDGMISINWYRDYFKTKKSSVVLSEENSFSYISYIKECLYALI